MATNYEHISNLNRIRGAGIWFNEIRFAFYFIRLITNSFIRMPKSFDANDRIIVETIFIMKIFNIS